MLSKFNGKKVKSFLYKLGKRKNQVSICIFVLYFIILLALYIIPLNGDLRLNQYNVSSFRLDHLIHVFFFIPASFIAPFFLRRTQFLTFKIIAVSFFIAIVFELIHLIVPYRAFTIEDLIANLIGVSLGVIIFLLFRKKD